jgi:RNA recognition motif-containing protein
VITEEEEEAVFLSASDFKISALFVIETELVDNFLRIRIQINETLDNLLGNKKEEVEEEDIIMEGHDCVAFIANMSYEYNHARIIELFSRVGTVLFLEMRPDPSGRHEHVGQGHIVFADSSTMVRACETLSGETVGGRPIRVTKSKDPTSTAGVLQRMKMTVPGGIPSMWGISQQQSAINLPSVPQAPQVLLPNMLTPSIPRSTTPAGPRAPVQVHTHVPAFPVGVDVLPSVKSFVEGMKVGNVRDVLGQLKEFVAKDPEGARTALAASPMLASSVLHLIATVNALSTQTPAYSAAQQYAFSMAPTQQDTADVVMQQQQQQQQLQSMPAQSNQQMQMQHMQQIQQQQMQMQMQVQVQQQQQMQQQQQQQSSEDLAQLEMLKTILAMTEEQLSAMDPDQRNGAMQVRYVLRTPESSLSPELRQLRLEFVRILGGGGGGGNR